MSLRKSDKKRHILITAGPTREKIDPIRFISNYSTGTFGYEIAKEAQRRGNAVTVVSGPTVLKAPKGVKFIRIESTLDMKRSVSREFPKSDCVIMASAVSDWRASHIAKKKIKKSSAKLTLELVENPDILGELGRKKDGKILVGFSLETEDLKRNAIKKLKEKNLDLIIANRFKARSNVFGDNKVDILIIDKFGNRITFSHKSKRELAKIILDRIEAFNI